MATPVADLYVRVRATFDELKKVGSQVEAALAPARQSLRRVGTALSASVTLPLLAVGKQALDTAARFDTLERGLTAIVGSSEEAAKQIKRLKEIAKAPGINFEQALAGSRNLQVVGFSAEFAEEAVKQLGNAVALAGGSADDLAEITRQLQQVKGLGKITAENFNVIAERAPVIRTALENAFQTTNIEELRKRGVGVDQFIQGIIQGLQGIPRATGGIANDLQNLRSDIEQIFLEIGKAIIPVAQVFVERISPAIQKAAQFIGELDEKVKISVLSFAGLLSILGPVAAGLSLLLSPIGLVVTAIAGIGTAAALLVDDWQPVLQRMIEIFESIRYHAVTQFANIAQNIIATVDIIIRAINLIGDIPGIKQLFSTIEAATKALYDSVRYTVDAILLTLSLIPGVKEVSKFFEDASIGSSETTSALSALSAKLEEVKENARIKYDVNFGDAEDKSKAFLDGLKGVTESLSELSSNVVVAPPSFDFPNNSTGPGNTGPALPERQAIPNFQAIDPAPIEQVTTSIDGMNLKLREAPIIAQEVNETFGAVGAIASLAFEGISSGIDSAIDRLFFVNGKFLELKNIAATLGDVFKNVFQNLVKDLVAATVKALALKAILAAFGISAPTGGFGGIFSTVLGGGGLGNFLGGGGGAPIGGGALPANRLSVQQSVTPYGVVQKINETAAVRSTRFYGG